MTQLDEHSRSIGKGALSLASGMVAGGFGLFAHAISDNSGYSDAVNITKLGFFGASILLSTVGTYTIIKETCSEAIEPDENQKEYAKLKNM